MSISLDPAVEAAIDSGTLRILPLVRFDLPGKTVGYHFGGRPFTWNGLEYRANSYLQPEGFEGSLGERIPELELTFSGVPVDDPDDAVAAIEQYAYLNALAVVSYVAGNAETDEVLGVITTNFFEIAEVNYEESATAESGEKTLTIPITLHSLSRRLRDSTHSKRTPADQAIHNDSNDTSLEYVNAVREVTVEWGQR